MPLAIRVVDRFQDLADAVNRIVGTVDSDGSRAVTERNV